MSTTHEFTLSDLPSDIIRRVVSAGLESINGIMLISPRWRSLALDHLSHRSRLPSINLSWRPEADGSATIGLIVLSKYQNYFGLDKWASKELPPIVENINDGMCVQFEKVVENARIESLLSRRVCRCSRVKRLEIIEFDYEKVEVNQMHILVKDLMPEELLISDKFGRKLTTSCRPSGASVCSSSTERSMSLHVETVTLDMDTFNSLGISIVGQESLDRGYHGIYLADVMTAPKFLGGAVEQDGRIEAGDMILQVALDKVTNDQAVDVLRQALVIAVERKGTIRLTVAKSSDPRYGVGNLIPVNPIERLVLRHAKSDEQAFNAFSHRADHLTRFFAVAELTAINTAADYGALAGWSLLHVTDIWSAADRMLFNRAESRSNINMHRTDSDLNIRVHNKRFFN